MTRYGAQFGPDITFLGVEPCDWTQPGSYADADIVILGAPFDGGTSHRPGTRFGPQHIRQTCYLPHDGSRPRSHCASTHYVTCGSTTQATSRCSPVTPRGPCATCRKRSTR
jgi:hypothetical protein